ncbi:hypothetical protein [Actinomadura roseirufa]|uniref:hypothetical protein n=1 Tax=Actinomadura roseirufa TaxID=2094049 RepID=UPI001041871C|nr:hypothetical protein [Actinomadura roseirufa]
MTTDPETRLRRAFEAATAGVQAPPEPDWDRLRPRRVSAVPAAVAAVAATLVLALTVGLVRGADVAEDAFTPGAATATPVRPAASPVFAMRQRGGSRPQIVDLATGAVRGTVRPPSGYDEMAMSSLAAAADNRTFFFTVRKSPAGRWMVARVHTGDSGRPEGRAVLVAQAPSARDLEAVAPVDETLTTSEPSHWASVDGLSVSPDATRLAMRVGGKRAWGISFWDLRTGRTATWGSSVSVSSLAWARDGSLLWASARWAGRLDPKEPPSVLRATRTLSQRDDAGRFELLPDGDRVVVRTTPTSGRLLKLTDRPDLPNIILDTWVTTVLDRDWAVSADGTHVLYQRNGVRTLANLTTGQRTPTRLDGSANQTSHFAW